MSDTAIVILAIGDEYLAYWQHFCSRSCHAYAAKHGYDIIVVSEPLDDSPRAQKRSPAYQKCLVLSQEFSRKYRQIVSLDCDIVINVAESPPIHGQTPTDRVGGVLSGGHIHEDLRCVLADRTARVRSDYSRGLQRWENLQSLAYSSHGLQPRNAVIQTGVLVASPAHHREVFEAIYHADFLTTRSYEQVPLSHAILSNDLFCPLDTRFNSVFYETALVHYPYLFDESLPDFPRLLSLALQTEFANNFFLHFAYDRDMIKALPLDQSPPSQSLPSQPGGSKS